MVKTPQAILGLRGKDGALEVLDLIPPQKEKSFPRAYASPDLKRVAAELTAYFSGKSKTFSVPIRAKGTPFQKRVWSVLTTIPFGATLSYGDVAARIGRPKSSRAVGNAVGQNPIAVVVPCHRILPASGKLGGYSGGVNIKQWLLEREGVKVQA